MTIILDCLQPASADRVPFYDLLKNYEWVTDFLKSLEIRQKITSLRETLRCIKNLRLSKSDVELNLKKHYEEYRMRRVNNIRIRIDHGRRDGDPFRYVDRDFMQPYISLSEIEEALALIDDNNTIGEKARKAESANIERQIAKLKIDLSEVSSPDFHPVLNAKVIGDVRDEFTRYWVNMQSRCDSPCGPQGLTLDNSTEREREAYKQLGIAKAINHRARFQPHPGIKYMT